MSTAKVNFTVENQAHQPSIPYNGISFVEGITKRGPIADPKTVISSWPQFEKTFGGLISESQFPHLCKRALEGGAKLRVNSIKVNAVKAAISKVSVLTLSAALVTANVINMKLNTTAMTAVTFASTSDDTLAAIGAQLKSQFPTLIQGTAVVTVAGGTDNDRVLHIVPKNGVELTFTDLVVTLGTTQPTITASYISGVYDATNTVMLFSLAPKHAGADYNNLQVTISAPSNGLTAYFNMTISHALEAGLTETYTNLKVTNLAPADQQFLVEVIRGSALVDVTYNDLSGITATCFPETTTYLFTGGDDGDALAAADYIGDSTEGTGFHAFDGYSDAYQICAPEISTTAVHVAGEAYAKARKDIHYWAYLSEITTDYTTLTDEVVAIGVDSKYISYFTGILKVSHPVTSEEIEIGCMGDVLALAATNDSLNFPFMSFAGPNKGVLNNLLGLKYNYGGGGSIGDLDMLSNKGINIIINRDGKTMLWGNFSGSLGNSPEKFLSVCRLELYIKKTLRPTMESFLEEPTDLQLTRQIYYTVVPFLDSLKRNRATYEVPVWAGDQQATTLADLQVNTPADFTMGKYKIKMKYTPIPSLQELTVGLVLVAGSGLTFES